MKRFAFIFGTRPEIIKMAPFIKEAQKRRVDFFIIHTGQHYSEIMDKVFWENLELPEPKYNLGVGSGTHAEQVGKMMIEVEKVLQKEKPDYVCVYADLNSSIAGALAAAKLLIPIIQLEAGLRSHDRSMPEEVNRLVVDRLASYFFAPTPLQREHLYKEGINDNIFIVGNLIADVVSENVRKAASVSAILGSLGLTSKNYFLATMHRPSGVDSPENFKNLLTGLGLVANNASLPVIYPIHPRSRKNLENFSLTIPNGVKIIDPLNYFDFLHLAANARVILSDSGGIQEEAAIMQVPLVTLRENTERQETLVLGSNVLAGFDPDTILKKVQDMDSRPRIWQHPYGENVAGKMWNILTEKLQLFGKSEIRNLKHEANFKI
jgi:UDP-N-acetylglucosamine 2-epimerase (non-hydrolysing)